MRPDLVMVAALVLASVGVIAWRRAQELPEASGGSLPGVPGLDWLNLYNLAEEAAAPFSSGLDEARAAANVRAFLEVIAHAEGTAGKADPYRVLFGGDLWAGSMAWHPQIARQFRHKERGLLWTSAAGKYQFMCASPIPDGSGRWTKVDTWTECARRLGLQDFGPESQDRAALDLIDRAGALQDVRAGRFEAAISKVRTIWASLPASGHGQPEKSIAWVRQVYETQGGTYA